MATINLTQKTEASNTPPAEQPLTPLKIFRAFVDLHRAGDFDAAALALGDCIYSLTDLHRDAVIDQIGKHILTEVGVTLQ